MPVGALLAWIAAYVLLIKAITYLAFARDKRCAQSGLPRISEKSLLALAALGGSVGGLLASHMLRHKTRKEPFRTLLHMIATAQFLAVLALCVPQVRHDFLQFIQTNILPFIEASF